MIPCPSCDTRNRRGSKYCYACGHPMGITSDVSCPACDRLNPGGSAFCGFCGAKIPATPPTGEMAAAMAAVAGPPAQVIHDPALSEAKSLEPPAPPTTPEAQAVPPSPGTSPAASPRPPSAVVENAGGLVSAGLNEDTATAGPQRELPPWLYEQPTVAPEGKTPAPTMPSTAAAPPLEQSKYLGDIPGALPKTEGWLSSAPKPLGDQAPKSKRKALGGCLLLPLLALLGAIGVVVAGGM